MGHLDTVHPLGTLAALPWRIDGERLYGPGVLDMKGGVFLALSAMRALQRAGVETPLPVTFLLTCDEEIGSPSTREPIEREAQRHKYVLVPEPARRDGGVTTGRYAIARYKLTATGRPSHAGARPGEGLSAIREVAHQIIGIDAMSKDESTLSCGVVRGGQWVNCVAASASFEILNMSKTEAALAETHERLAALEPADPRLELHLEVGVRRPLWTTSERDFALYEVAKSIAGELGFELPRQSSPGGSDGNFTGALDITTLDGLGPLRQRHPYPRRAPADPEPSRARPAARGPSRQAVVGVRPSGSDTIPPPLRSQLWCRTERVRHRERSSKWAEAYIVDAVRTAGGRRGGKLAGWHPADLGAEVLNALVARTGIDPAAIDDVIVGCVTQAGEQAFALARNAVLASRLPRPSRASPSTGSAVPPSRPCTSPLRRSCRARRTS